MMAQDAEQPPAKPREKHDHDWHSCDCVRDWLVRDRGREEERRVWLDRTVAAIPFARDARLRVIDIGCGYGAVSKAVLAAFPNAELTLHDYSQVMFDHARDNLAAYADRVSAVRADLRDPDWAKQVGGPFDVAVSALCLHNTMDMAVIAAAYRGVREILRPGGCFIDYDHVDHIEGLDAHLRLFEQAAYTRVECLCYEAPTAIIRATS
jgi:SAM-dependent methyltransferase